MPTTVIIDTPDLGDRTYLIHDGQHAVVIDPQRDIDRLLLCSGRLGVSITHVFETHVHNDYISGGPALSQLTGAEYFSHADDPLVHQRTGVRDGDAIHAGTMTVRALATPGHTLHHLSYLVEADNEVTGVYTGGSMLYGSVGRPDLVAPQLTRQLAFAQHSSVRRLVSTLPAEAPVYPTHGFGSWCAVSATDHTASTVGEERTHNPAAVMAADAFVDFTLTRLDVYPDYFRRMGPLNSGKAPLIDLAPVPLDDASSFRRRIEMGQCVIDLRPRAQFARAHLTGSLNFDASGPVTTYLAWLLPSNTALVLLADTPTEILAARRRLERVGLDRPVAAGVAGEVLGDTTALASYRRATFSDLVIAAADRPVHIVDVRTQLEWRRGHIDGSENVPLHELATRAELLPHTELWVHCGTGHRSSIAASILDRAGHHVTHIDDSFDNADLDRLSNTLGRWPEGRSSCRTAAVPGYPDL